MHVLRTIPILDTLQAISIKGNSFDEAETFEQIARFIAEAPALEHIDLSDPQGARRVRFEVALQKRDRRGSVRVLDSKKTVLFEVASKR